MKSYGKQLSLVTAIISGICVPQATNFAFLIQYLIMGMLFSAFLEVTPHRGMFDRSHCVLLAANLTVAIVVYVLLEPFNHQLALAGFMTAISPTATAAPVIVGFMNGSVAYAIAAVLITNGTVVLILPLVLAWQSGLNAALTWTGFVNVSAVIFVPFVLAQVTRRYAPPLARTLKQVRVIAFWAWLAVLFMATASASHFISQSAKFGSIYLVPLAAVSFAICVVNFAIGYLIGLPKHGFEASQSLGQKNTMLTVWFSLAFYSPFIALGPTFYIVYHNLYNSYQMLHRNLKVSAPVQEMHPDP